MFIGPTSTNGIIKFERKKLLNCPTLPHYEAQQKTIFESSKALVLCF
jgi:hypothetical protein